MRFQWIGGATFLLELGPFRILGDPTFANEWTTPWHPTTGEAGTIKRVSPIPKVALNALDLILITHTHTDHFAVTASKQLPASIPAVAPAEQTAAVKASGFRDVIGLDPWADRTWTKGKHGLRVMAVPARHGVEDRAAAQEGPCNGYIIEHQRGGEAYRVYWTGDTVWFDGMEEIRQRVRFVDLIVPHMGAAGVGGPLGRLTMDAAEGVRLALLFQPPLIIPVHHHTFTHYAEPVDVFERRLGSAGYVGRLVVLKEGEWIERPD